MLYRLIKRNRFVNILSFFICLGFFALFLLINPQLLSAQNNDSENSNNQDEEISFLKLQIETAASGNRYEEALRIIEEGKENFPQSPIFFEVSGSLFMEKELYKISLNEYLSAWDLYLDQSNIPPGHLILDIAVLYGLLDKNEESLSVFENLLNYSDYSQTAKQRLSWMYFKTSRLDEGISKIEKWLTEEFDPELAHSLGVLYSSKYNYEKSFENYMDSIKYAEENKLNYFASIAYYNLSLLELSFYHFEDSYNYAEKSLKLVDRPNGYLGRANISILKMDLDKTQDDLLSAKSNLEHPIPLLELTEMYLLFGAYQNASKTLAEIELWEDSSWMYSFGYNKVSYALILSKLYHDYFSGLYHIEKTRVVVSPSDKIKKRFNLLKYKSLSFYNKVRKRNYEKVHAKENLKKGNTFDFDWTEYSRSEGYKNRSIKYLKKTETFETEKIPLSQPHYTKEWGTILGDPTLLQASIDQLHPEWERQIICESYKELILIYKKSRKTSLQQKNISLLYSINPGGLRQYEILLPLSLEVTIIDSSKEANKKEGLKKIKQTNKLRRKMTRLIKKTGTEIISKNITGYSLRIFWDKKEKGNLSYYLFDKEENLLVNGEETIANPSSFKNKELAIIVNKIFNRIYAPMSQGSPLY